MSYFHKPNPLKASLGLDKEFGYLQNQKSLFQILKITKKKRKKAKKLIQQILSILPVDPTS